MKAPGEEQLSQEILQYVLADYMGGEAQQHLQEKTNQALVIKPDLDTVMQDIAMKHNGSMSSRIKQPHVILKKIAQKRLEGRHGYGFDDINDTLGHRIIVQKEQIPEVIKAIRDSGLKIVKQQRVINKDSQYEAYHMDMEYDMPDGKKLLTEVQIMTPQDEASATITHDAHAVHGEDIPSPVQKELKPMVDTAKHLPDKKAEKVSKTLVDIRKNNGDRPLPSIVPKEVLKRAV